MLEKAITTDARPELSIPDYEFLRPIGRGAYGEVWLARNATGSLVALKIVQRAAFDHDRPFDREFEGIQRFEPISRSDPSQVAILHVGRGDGFFYYVMELADGAESNQLSVIRNQSPEPRAKSLITEHCLLITSYVPKTLKRLLNDRGALPAEECLAIALSLTRALAHLHGHGLVHRDVKPSNVIFVGGVAKLADIGLVTSVDATRSFVGTEGYLPPEGAGTPQADLYSLGKVLYEMSTGCDRKEFPALPPDIATRSDRDALAELNAVVVRACQIDPRQRYASAKVLQTDLALLQQGQSIKRKRGVERGFATAKKAAVVVGLIAILAAIPWLAAVNWKLRQSGTSPQSASTAPITVETKSIAVFPFDNDSPDKADEYLGMSISEELSSALSRIPELRVLGRDSAFLLKNSKDRRAAAQQLKLRAVLDGTARKTGNRLRLTAQLVNPADGFVLWSEPYEREMGEIFGIQSDIAEKVAQALDLTLTDTVRTRLAIKTTKNLEAYQSYLEGRYNLSRVTALKAMDHFQSAIRLDTNFAAAYAGLADCYGAMANRNYSRVPRIEYFSNALSMAEKAVGLDQTLAEAHTALATAKYYRYDWAGAERDLQLAMRLNPNYAAAQRQYTLLLRLHGRFDEAIAAGQRAKGLDPLSLRIRCSLGWTFFDARRYEQAQKEFEEALKMNQNDERPPDGLGWCYQVKGKHEEAITWWERRDRIRGVSPEKIAELNQAYRQAGMRGYWEKQIEQRKAQSNAGEYVDPFWIARDYALVEDDDQACEWLERAYKEGSNWMPLVAMEHGLSRLHSDPRFAALLKKMGLEMPVWKK